jgi:hypothetical protein
VKLCQEPMCMRKRGHQGMHFRRWTLKDEGGTRVVEDEWGDLPMGEPERLLRATPVKRG